MEVLVLQCDQCKSNNKELLELGLEPGSLYKRMCSVCLSVVQSYANSNIPAKKIFRKVLDQKRPIDKNVCIPTEKLTTKDLTTVRRGKGHAGYFRCKLLETLFTLF